MPASCSPLNGVTLAGHPAAAASVGELNHSPRWNVCTGEKGGLALASGNGPLWTTGAGAVPGATANVSMLKRPTNVWSAIPFTSVCRSPTYHEIPNGAFGTWI